MSTITATQNIDIRNDSFFSILSILTEDDRIFLLVFLINPICSHSYNFEYTPHHKGTVLRRRLRWATWRYSTGKEASLALPLLLITQHLYIRCIPATY